VIAFGFINETNVVTTVLKFASLVMLRRSSGFS